MIHVNNMGARIEGAGTDTISIEGVAELKGTHHSILPDRIETGTYLVAATMTGGRVKLKNTRPGLLDAVIAKLKEAGADPGDPWQETHSHRRSPVPSGFFRAAQATSIRAPGESALHADAF